MIHSPIQSSFNNWDSIQGSRQAFCYNCVSPVDSETSLRCSPMGSDSVPCHQCHVDSLVSDKDFSFDPAKFPAKSILALRQARWHSFSSEGGMEARQEDLACPTTRQQVIQEIVDAAKERRANDPQRRHQDYANFVEETALEHDGLSDEYLECLRAQQDADRYNEWQNTTGSVMTDGLQDDFCLFQFGEQLRQLEASDTTRNYLPHSLPYQEPHTFGPPSFADYTQVSLSCLGELADFGFSQHHYRQLIGMIIGQEGKHFNWLTQNFGAHYIWFNRGQGDVMDEDLTTPCGEHYWNARIEIWAHPSVIEVVRQNVINHVSERISHFAVGYVLEHCRDYCSTDACYADNPRRFHRQEVTDLLQSIESLLFPGITLMKWGMSHEIIRDQAELIYIVDIDYLLRKAVVLQCDAPYDTLERFLDQLVNYEGYSVPFEEWHYVTQMDGLNQAMDYEDSCHWSQHKWKDLVRWLYNNHFRAIREEAGEDGKTEGDLKELMEQWCYYESELVKSIVDKYETIQDDLDDYDTIQADLDDYELPEMGLPRPTLIRN